ncbi:MAG: hypothetical protein ABI402_14160 [Ferruginibacter sp.]
MKKYSAIIFLPFLFLLAFVNAGFTSVEKNNTATSYDTKTTDYSKAVVNYPNAEIEHANVSNAGQFHPGLQRVPVCFSNDIYRIIFSTAVPLPVCFSGIELFDNHNLSYNYPSHNFW